MRWRRIAILGTLVLAFLFMVMIGLMYAFARIPDANDISVAQSVIVVDREGRSVGRIHAEADRVSVKLDQMPEHFRNAVISTEDRRFYSHGGIVVTSIVRAAFANTFKGDTQGGSTITQQYVKNAFVGNERSLWRKLKEAVLSVKLEKRRSKAQILEDYLNTIYFGRGAYGCEAAAQTYFGVRCSRLTLIQSALLAGIIRAPERYDPFRDTDAARARRDQVIDFMVRDEHITPAEGTEAKEEAVRAKRRTTSRFAAHYLDELQRDLERRLGARRLYGGGVRVIASLDYDAQKAAEQAVRDIWPRATHPEAALVAIDPKTGAVRALVGSRDYARRELNLVTQARRQPGSTFKPAVLAAALEDGMSPNKRYRAPASYDAPGYPTPVRNYDGRDYGTLSIAQATWDSVNTVYIQLIHDVGASNVVEIAHALGIGSKLQAIDGLALGVNEVTPLELANMFATLAARGIRHAPTYAERVTIRGKTAYEADRRGARGVHEDVADNANAVLQGVIKRGTGQRADIGRPEAGKTGTTEENVDAWFAGYTPDLVTLAWNGFPEKRRSLRNITSPAGCSAQFGGGCPAEMVKRVLRVALADVPPSAFPRAATIEDTSSPTASSTPTRVPTPTLPVTPSQPQPTPTPKKTQSPKPTATATPTGAASP
jgi:penicillin-binding protein 1A